MQAFVFFKFILIGISFRRGRNKKGRYSPQPPRREHRINGEIRASEIRLIDENDEALGTCSLQEGLDRAREKGVDLVEISRKASPPVCKIIDYGKMVYALKKKEQKKKVTNKPLEMKGIRLTFRMGEGDALRQQGKAQEFLEAGHPIKIQLLMKGREKAHKDLALEKIKGFIQNLQNYGQLDSPAKVSGHQIIAVLKPSKSQN